MKSMYQRIMIMLAGLGNNDMAELVLYYKNENEILRGKLPERITVTPAERNRLVKYGKGLGSKLKDFITIVTYRTFLRWVSDASKETNEGEKVLSIKKGRGRPKTDAEIIALVLRIANETGWGYTRIHDELKKLGVRKIARSTVRNILRENGIDPGPRRGIGTWNDFIQRHIHTIWACDFCSKKVWTMAGLAEYFVLVFIEIGTRRVHIVGMTQHPDAAWMAQQARNISQIMTENEIPAEYLIRDLDTKFTEQFDAILESAGVEIVPVGPRAPNLNAHVERLILTLKSECLDNFIVFGENHLRYLLSEFLDYYHQHRPHQGVGNILLNGEQPPEIPPPDLSPDGIVRHEFLGGLLKHYEPAKPKAA